MLVIVMGVSGCGKTETGRALAQSLGAAFLDADDFHPEANIAKMKAGIPLDDGDRAGWLSILAGELSRATRDMVLACSALKEKYREVLRGGASFRLVYLKADRATIVRRLGQRKDHFMNPALVDSQFAALEEPRDALVLDATLPVDRLVAMIRADLALA